MEREYPKRPVLAVAGVLLKEDSVLLVKRANEPSKGKWSLPGGVVELGETVGEALKREMREELSIEVTPKSIVDVVEKIVFDDKGEIKYHYIILEFLAEAGLKEPKVGSDVVEFRWIELRKLHRLDLDNDMKQVISRAVSASRPTIKAI